MAPYIRPENPSASWMNPARLSDDDFVMKDGRIFLGRTKDGRTIGVDDNRHVVTIAGSRAGKSATSLMSNLLTWDGSAMVVDPKGELATNTALHRAKMGQDVFILDPFGEVTGEAEKFRASFNPLDELRAGGPRDVVDDASTLADALITSDGRTNDHWSMSAKNLIRGLCLYALHRRPQDASLVDVRALLTSPAEREKKAPAGAPLALADHFEAMTKEDAFDGVLAGMGSTMAGKPKSERGSIISTAIEQTSFLDSIPMREHLAEQGLTSMRALKRKPTTIYLVLPSSRMGTHFRWLRAVLTQAMTALERTENATRRPVLFVLEEFPTLGHMRLIEASAGLMAGYDVKL
ncbi:type IV secretory system conjugative DNA transfer family protein, partial [Shimia haliotis]